MNSKWFTNPFFAYILSFTLAFTTYNLRWAEKYPTLSWQVKLFMLATFIISFFLGFILEKYKRNEFHYTPRNRYNIIAVGFLGSGYLLEFAYTGGIPFLFALRGGYNYKDFTGIPTFHVILSTFNIFYSIYLFHQYSSASSGRKMLLLYFILSLIFHLLVLNRGAIMITLASSFFISLMKIKKLKLSRLIFIPVGILVTIYLFGIIGNMRYSVSQEDKNFILRIGGATDSFIENSIPSEYYWGYLYIASPIGNFQNMVTESEGGFRWENLKYFAATEPLPDFISKRVTSIIAAVPPSEDPSKFLVIEALNAPTVYFRSFFLLGWGGAWLMFIYSAMVMLIYPFLLRKSSRYYNTGWASLVTIVSMSIFSNMWISSGAVLLWPIAFSLFERIKLQK